MSNYAVWNNRLRHEWIAKPRKGKYLSKRKRERIGIQAALERNAPGGAGGEEARSAEA